MEYRQLGKSGLQVSVIGLGTNNFGRTVDAKGTALVVSHALDLGINTVDTSNSYGGTLSEEYLGRALKAVAICTATWSDVGLEALPTRMVESGDRSAGPLHFQPQCRVHLRHRRSR